MFIGVVNDMKLVDGLGGCNIAMLMEVVPSTSPKQGPLFSLLQWPPHPFSLLRAPHRLHEPYPTHPYLSKPGTRPHCFLVVRAITLSKDDLNKLTTYKEARAVKSDMVLQANPPTLSVCPPPSARRNRSSALLHEKMQETASYKFIGSVDDMKLLDDLGGRSLAMPVEVV
ncbi:hypothetical protein ACSQ67_009048 [Phaseolus vulgaris]